jgi:hypothetical protein
VKSRCRDILFDGIVHRCCDEMVRAAPQLPE